MKFDQLKAKLRGAWRSWTIWFNGLLLAVMPFIDNLKDAIPQLESYLDAAIYKNVMLAVVAVNIALRMKTSKPLQEK